MFEGPGLHSKMDVRHPIRAHCGLSLQPAYVLREVAAANAKSVLDVGCGRGFCTFYLANLMPDVKFMGIDMVPRHAEFASCEASKGGYNNVQFSIGDATRLDELGTKFDIIFSVEAMCHLDTDQKMRDFLNSASLSLTPKGKIVLVDGFRSPSFDTCSPNQQLAMKLAERGFRIRRMPSKALWASMGSESGFKVVRDVDLTHQVLPFWRFGWRFAHVALKFSPLIRYTCPWFVPDSYDCLRISSLLMRTYPTLDRWVASSSLNRRETAANLLSVSTAAHAFRNKGSAEYGVMVLEKQ